MTTGRRRLKQPEGEPVAASIDLEAPFESVTVVYGEELYSPVQFHSFRIGGHSVTVKPNPGETGADCIRRATSMLAELADAEFAARLEGFRKRYKEVKRGQS